jgi:large subunit ribosomal protein L5
MRPRIQRCWIHAYENWLIAGQRELSLAQRRPSQALNFEKRRPWGVGHARGDRSFLDRLINLALPRVRDFQGISVKSFDGHGNYSLGVEEQLMFPDIDYDKIDQISGMDISIITTSKTNIESFALKEFRSPFKATK